MSALQQSAFLEKFSCLGDKCADTCCKGWRMQLDEKIYQKYVEHAPELLDAVVSDGTTHIMKRDDVTDYCVKFSNGLCGIHQDKGTDFLGDACNFFPRITSTLGEHIIMTAALSCPEIARLALTEDNSFSHQGSEILRLPSSLKNYLPPELSADAALQIHQQFLQITQRKELSSANIMAQIFSVTQSLEHIEIANWAEASAFYLKNAAARLPTPEIVPDDPFNLLHALAGLVGATKPAIKRPKLDGIIADIATALDASIIHQASGTAMTTSDNSYRNWLKIEQAWQKNEADFEPILRRWITAQLAAALFPFGGFGESLTERASIIAIRLSTVKLALMVASNQKTTPLAEEETLNIIQTLARFLDHLADPSLSIKIYREAGWLREPRLRALLRDF